MTIKIETEWGVVYPYAPEVVHPMVDRASAEAHARSTGSILMCRDWSVVRQQPGCTDHNPVQHRDGKPAWCKRCGLTASFTVPEFRFVKSSNAPQPSEQHPVGDVDPSMVYRPTETPRTRRVDNGPRGQ